VLFVRFLTKFDVFDSIIDFVELNLLLNSALFEYIQT